MSVDSLGLTLGKGDPLTFWASRTDESACLVIKSDGTHCEIRGMIIHDCGRRMNGNHRHQSAYYMCHPKNGNRGRPDKYVGHPKAAYIREDLILDAVSAFYTDRVFGTDRRDLLMADLATTDGRSRHHR